MDEGELESEIYEAEEQETLFLEKIAKVKFFLWPQQPPVDVSPVQLSSDPRSKATQSKTQLHSELPSESAIDASHMSNGSTRQNLTVPQVNAPHQHISIETSHHITPLIPNLIGTHAPVPVNNTNAITSSLTTQLHSSYNVSRLPKLNMPFYAGDPYCGNHFGIVLMQQSIQIWRWLVFKSSPTYGHRYKEMLLEL